MQMLWTFSGHLLRHQGYFFWVFRTSPGHVPHFYMPVTHLFRILPMKLFFYITQMLWAFSGHLPKHQGCFFQILCTGLDMYMCVPSLFKKFTHEIICLHHADAPGFLRTFTLTLGLFFSGVFHTSLGHVLHFYMPVTYLFRSFTHEIICLRHADAPGMSCINMPYSCKYEVHVLGMCGKPEKSNLSGWLNVPGKSGAFA